MKTNFFRRIERLKKAGTKHTIEIREASQFFGQHTTVWISEKGAYASWTLKEKGGLNKRTSVSTYAAIEGKKVPIADALRRINY